MRQDVGEALEVSRLELLCCASTQGDLETWQAFQQSLEEIVLIIPQPVEKLYCRAYRLRKTSENSLIGDQFVVLWQQNMIVRSLKNSSVDFFNRLTAYMV